MKENRKLLKLCRQGMGRASTWPVEVGRQRNRKAVHARKHSEEISGMAR